MMSSVLSRETRMLQTSKLAVRLLIQDFVLAVFSFLGAVFLRLDFSLSKFITRRNLLDAILAGTIVIIFGWLIGSYRRKFQVGSLEEVLALTSQAFIASVSLLFIRIFYSIGTYPRSVPIISAMIFIILSLGGRLTTRLLKRKRFELASNVNRIIVYGAGSLGNHISNLIALDNKLYLVGFIDDDNKKQNLLINGKKVLGTSEDLEKIFEKFSVKQIIVASSRFDEKKLDKLRLICKKYNVRITSIPSAGKLLLGLGNLNELISLNEENILGRVPVSINKEDISKLLQNKKILVTGAGGSIGSEIVKQCLEYEPAVVYSLDRDESALHTLELETTGTGLMNEENIVLSDIRDLDALRTIFLRYKPEIVFHAAALKHLPILENYPMEAEKTNVIGTSNVLSVAKESGVKIFVNISTDKAADPTSILGKTKLEAEKLTLKMSRQTEGVKYISVRFGNVIGSRGSVLHTFKHQIDNDLSVTITDPEVSRYFMTVKEAVSLVLQSAVIGENGETLILDMGQPVKIADVANFMIKESGKNVPIVFTGLRSGEKLHERLASSTENLVSRSHPKIFHTKVELND